MKQNDWIVATLNNPEFTAADFKNVQGLSLDNTQLLSKDDYLKSSFITENDAFKNSDGTFNKDKFDTFYNTQASKFADFQQESSLDNYTYGFWDIARKPESKVDIPKIGINLTLNPEHRSTGVIGQGLQGERQFSDMELAQQQKIFDFSNNKVLDYSANEASLFTNPIRFFKELFSEPLVLATYDKDEDDINPITGQMEHHVKGEKKLNGAGEYYLETLGGRSIVGKNVLSMGDIITSDTSELNKYDFFDSDGLDKNPTGVIAKNLAAIAPMAFLGPNGVAIYSGLYVLREMSKTLPMLQGMVTSLLGVNSDTKLLNNIAAYGSKFTSGTSDYAKENTFSFENFGNLISDVALQWGQQKVIAQSVAKLQSGGQDILNAAKGKAMYEYEKQALNILNRAEKGEQLSVLQYTGQLSREGIENSLKNGSWENTIIGQAALKKYLPEAQEAYAKRVRLGQDLSLAYMALISNTDVYDSAIEHGASKREAAAMALGSTIGMFGVDKYLGLGEMFFDDPDAVARRTFKNAIRTEAENLNNKITTLANPVLEPNSKKNYLNFINRGIKIAQNAVSKYHSDIKDRSLSIVGKSIGEGLEEVSEEFVTDFTKSLYELAGSFGYTTTKDVGAWDQAKERYLMSFFGGSIGGGLFGGIEAMRNPNSASDKNTQKELLYLVKEGKTKDILEQLNILHDKGQLGSKELSVDSENGAFLTSNENHKSQNDFVYDIMKDSILQMDAIINGNQLNISDEDLFERMVLSDPKFTALKDVLQDKSYITGYYDKYQDIVNSIYENEKAIKDLEDGTPDPEKRKTVDYINQMQQLQDENKRLKQEAEDFKNGKYSSEYVERMLFAMNPEISGTFLSMNFAQFVRNKYNRDINDLSVSEQSSYREQWENYNKTQRKLDFEEAFKLYKDISKQINPILENLSKTSDVKSWEKIADQLEQTFPSNFLKSVNDIEDSEVEGIENLSQEEILIRKQEIANQYNNDNISKFIQNFADNNSIVDSSTYRRLIAILNRRRRDIVTQEITQRINFENIDDSTKSKYFEILNKLNEDFSNLDSIRQEISQITESHIKKSINFGKAIVSWNDIPDKGFYSFTDLLDLLNQKFNKKTITEEDVDDFFQGEYTDSYFVQDLIDAHNLEINPSSENSQQLSELIEKYENPENSFTGFGMQNAVVIGNNKNNEIIQDLIQQSTESIESSVDEVISKIKINPYYKSLTDVKRKLTFDNNPTLSLIKSIANKLGENFSNIEDTLQSIYEQYERLDNIEDYLLSDEQIQALEKAKQYMDIAEGFINAASQKSNYFHIMPFYKTINEFNKEHKNVFGKESEVLPELDNDTANVSIQSLNEYRREIDSWINKSKANSLNKIKEFKEFDKKFTQIKLQFLRDNFTKEGFGEDLIEGVESLDLNDPNVLFELEKLLYYNFKRKGLNSKDLAKVFKRVIPKLEENEFKYQLTSKLDGNITPDSFTDYDKFTYLSSIFASDPIDFYRYYKDFIENRSTNNEGETIAPLAFQEHAIRLAYSQEQNPKLINEILEEVSPYVNKDSRIKTPVLKNTTIITGLGGSGKTQVVARALTTSDSVWFSGPSDTQIQNLLTLNPKGIGKTKEELFKEILEPGEYEAVIAEFNSNTVNGKKLSVNKNSAGPYVVLKNIKYKKLEDVPDKIIIDEATLFSSAELQIISQWAEKNNVNVLLLGDENQNGNNQAGQNIAPEFIFAFRTPRLSISLRQANYWKYINQKPLESLMDQLRTADTKEKVKLLGDQFLNKDFKEYQLHYYLQNGVLTGDMIADELTDNVLNSLTGDIIGYVGDTDTQTYQKLKNSGKNIVVLNPEQVQGQEFDYVVIDKDWKYEGTQPHELFHYMQDLYTMITRSRKGSVIIDNHLSDMIAGSKEENYTTDAITLNPQSKEEFTKSKLEYLNSLDLTPRTIEPIISKTEQNPEPLKIDTPVEVPQIPIEIDKQLNSTDQDDEQKESDSINSEPISENPFTVYGNIGFTGLTTRLENGNEIWDSNGSLRDLDILLSDDAQKYLPPQQRKKSLTNSTEQILYSQYLSKLKSFITFGGEYRKLPNIITNLFTEDDINSMEYFVVSENEDDNKHSIIRIQQNLQNDKRSFINDSQNVPQVLSLQGRITKNGKTYVITLGTLESLEGSKKSKNILIDQLSREHPDMSQSQISTEADNIINGYERYVRDLINQKEKRINTPYFTKTTGLRKVNKRDYRIQDILQKSEKSKFEYATEGYVLSPIYTIIDEEEIKKLGLSEKLVGKPIMYVSANSNLNSSELAGIYSKQKLDPKNNTPQVRCIVLDSEGISFESMLRPAYSKNHFKIKVSDAKTFHLPFVSLPMGVRMYIGLWNFRANLINFNKAVKEEFGNELELADELAKLDSQLYQQAKDANNGKYINQEEFRNWVKSTQTQEIQEKIQRLWDFNDKLTSNNIREFRLGYSTLAGAYVRKNSDSENVIYINRDLAEKYEESIKNLFSNVIDANEDGTKGLIPPISDNVSTFIDKKTTLEQWKQLEDGWVKKVMSGGSLDVSTSEGTINFNFGSSERIRMLPTVLKQIGINLLTRQYDIIQFDQELNSGQHQIKVGDDSLNYMSVIQGIFDDMEIKESGIINDKPIGTEAYNTSTGEGIIDKRLVNMFNLAFHGIPHTREFNDLTTPGLLKATDALFPNGFFVDTFISSDHTDGINKEVLTDKSFYSTNVVPTGPIIRFSFKKPGGNNIIHQEINPALDLEIQNINSILGTNYSDDLEQDELEELLKIEFKNRINSLFDGTRVDNILDTYVDYIDKKFITLEEKLKEKYPNIQGMTKLSDTQYEFSNDGTVYYLQKGAESGEYIILESKPQILSEPETKNKSANLQQIADYISQYLSLSGEDLDLFNSLFVKNDGNSIINRQGLIKRANKLTDEFEPEFTNKVKDLINQLPDANNGTCMLPIK